LSVLILLTSIYIKRTLEFTSFPSLLLMTTLFRLGLNVATTRLILSHGHEGPAAAGSVIEAFGNFVVGNNYVVGFIVFVILVVINFIVITKGSSRIAEVAARFTLDAMPGKQMAIDADLSAGLINETEARERRKKLEDEANFLGAMDIGVGQHGLSFSEAGHTYTLLTIGDGLVTQLPSLLVSTAAGLMVS